MPWTQGNPGRGGLRLRGADSHTPDPPPTGVPVRISPVGVMMLVAALLLGGWALTPGAPRVERATVVDRVVVQDVTATVVLALVDRPGAPQVTAALPLALVDDPHWATGSTVSVTTRGRGEVVLDAEPVTWPWLFAGLLLVGALLAQTAAVVARRRHRAKVARILEAHRARAQAADWFG